LGAEDYGFYSLVISVPSLLIGLVNVGMKSTVTRFSTDFRAKGKMANVRNVVKSAILFELTLGIIASVFCYVFSDTLATYLINTPEASPYIKIAAILIVFQTLFNILDAAFIGLDTMENNAITSITRAITKTVLSPLLIILGFSIIGAIIGHISCYVIGVVVSFALLFFKLRGNHGDTKTEPNLLKSMLKYGLPLYLSALIVLFSTEYQTIILAFFASKAAIGNFQVSALFSTAIALIVYPFTALFPAFSKFSTDSKELGQFFRRSVKYTALVLIPTSLAITVMASDIILTIYGSEFALASTFIVFYLLTNLRAGFGSVVLPYLFSGVGRTDVVLKSSLIYLVSFFPLAFLLITSYDIIGLIVAGVICSFFSTLYELFMASKMFNLSIDVYSSAKIYVTSALTAFAVFIFLSVSPFSGIINLILGGALFLFTYLTVLPLMGTFNYTDIEIFRGMFQKIKSLWPFVKILLSYETIILKYFRNTKK
jgi:O-antigen/teichoic acid export membrane protein